MAPSSGGWYSSAAEVSLEASDATSGVKEILVSLDGSLAAVYDLPFSLGEGVHQIEVSAVDAVGNVEVTLQIELSVDVTPPIAVITGIQYNFPP